MGKTFIAKEVVAPLMRESEAVNVEYIDCNKIATLITSLETLEEAITYLRERMALSKRISPSLIVLDSINALCPFISSDE